jgi:hypothetical protein
MYYTDAKQFKDLSGYEIDGIWYPRATKIVEIKAKPALYKFYGDLDSFAQGEEIKAKSASEGTLIHEAAESILVGKSPVVDPSITPSINSFVDFLEKNNIQVDPSYVEKQVINRDDKYAGTLDALALIDGKFGVLDIKTSQAIYRDYNLQTSAYMGALEKDFKNLQTRWILRIDQIKKCFKCGASHRSKGGRDKIRPMKSRIGSLPICNETDHQWSELQGEIELKEFPYWKEDYKAFLAAKKLWEWDNEYWLRQIGYI